MNRFLVLSVLGGCLYLPSINQRPSLGILNTTGEEIERGQLEVTLQAEVNDPEGHIVNLAWRLYVCDDASDVATCDDEPAIESSAPTFVFDAPIARANATPAQSLLVELEGVDDFGAEARPRQQLIIPLRNGKPSLKLSQDSSYGFTIGTPIEIFAVYDDADDTANNVTLVFTLFSPGASTAVLTDVCTPQPMCLSDLSDPDNKLQQGKKFTPDLAGNWQIQVVASDPLGGEDGSTTLLETVVVVVDEVPCLGVVSPAPPGANLLPLSEPTLFQVHQIIDAIDPFPTDIEDPILGQSSFHWSLKLNGGARQPLGTETGNSLAFDPASFTPGDVVELRVEIADRQSPFPLTCDPADATCQLDPTLVPACLQRQTWKVDVR
ncbi:MAG: hypothetical protein H0V17_31950 [Deltaproteobacteria bacterium]|nr:hypothetical protein [Deltaproteobacteria bacterium]